MSLFVCSKCGCIDNTATSYYWALIRPCKEKESGFNFLYNPNNGRMQSGHIIIDGIDLFKQIIHER